ncbi:MAG TPA: carboxypeptidase-like regulatory domain-containing protein [Gemmatimonadales bacterium]|nr:carboxypeptidase-like regulatory domain-containing protein [Gemmatimonadales bacterium]
MNRTLLLVVLAGAAACHSDATAPTSTAPLSGTVSSQSGPIANAQVVATDTGNPSESDTATTDASGHYAFEGVSPGTRTVGLVLSSLPPACIPPGSTDVTIVAGGKRTLLLQVLCVDVTGSYTGYLKVTAGGAAATLDSILASLGAAGLFPDSGAFQLTVNPVLDSNTFQFSGQYSGVGYAAIWTEDTLVLHGPVVQTHWPVILPSITYDGVLTVQPVCTPSVPAQFTVGVDSLAGGHLTEVTGTLDYACSVTLTGLGTLNGSFHILLSALKT